MQKQVALAGVEQQAALSHLEVEGEAVLRQQAAGMNGVLDQYRDDDGSHPCQHPVWTMRPKERNSAKVTEC